MKECLVLNAAKAAQRLSARLADEIILSLNRWEDS
jgi:hypothetical protein